MLNLDTVFELVEPGTFVGMRSQSNAIKSFYIAEVLNKGVAENNMSDENGHSIMSGEPYLEVNYLQKGAQKRRIVQYHRPKKPQRILIHIAEVFIANADLNADLCMDIDKDQSISAAI